MVGYSFDDALAPRSALSRLLVWQPLLFIPGERSIFLFCRVVCSNRVGEPVHMNPNLGQKHIICEVRNERASKSRFHHLDTNLDHLKHRVDLVLLRCSTAFVSTTKKEVCRLLLYCMVLHPFIGKRYSA